MRLLPQLGYIMYRMDPSRFRSFRNIDNPIYKKTTVDGIKLEKSRSPAHAGRGNEEVRAAAAATAPLLPPLCSRFDCLREPHSAAPALTAAVALPVVQSMGYR